MPSIVPGPYAAAVQALVNTSFDQTISVDIYQTQAVIDAYENVKNSVTIPPADLRPTLPAEPTADG